MSLVPHAKELADADSEKYNIHDDDVERDNIWNKKVKHEWLILRNRLYLIVSAKPNSNKTLPMFHRMSDEIEKLSVDDVYYAERVLDDFRKTTRAMLESQPQPTNKQKFELLEILSELAWIRTDLLKLQHDTERSNEKKDDPERAKHPEEENKEEWQRFREMLHEKRNYSEFIDRIENLADNLLKLIPDTPEFDDARLHVGSIHSKVLTDNTFNPHEFITLMSKTIATIFKHNKKSKHLTNHNQPLHELLNDLTRLRVDVIEKNMRYAKQDTHQDIASISQYSNLQHEKTRKDTELLERKVRVNTDHVKKAYDTIEYLLQCNRDQRFTNAAIQHLENFRKDYLDKKKKSKWYKLGEDASALPALLEQL